MTNIAAKADNTGQEKFLGRLGALVLDLPMLEFVEEVCGLIYRRQHLLHGDIFPLRKEGPQRHAFYFLLLGRFHMEGAVGTNGQIRVFT